MIDSFAMMIFLMLAGHALADGPLQTAEISNGKRAPDLGRRLQFLAVHSFIHGGAVALITGIWWLGLAEVVAHTAIDATKCAGRISFGEDQALHLLCKFAWAAIALDRMLAVS